MTKQNLGARGRNSEGKPRRQGRGAWVTVILACARESFAVPPPRSCPLLHIVRLLSCTTQFVHFHLAKFFCAYYYYFVFVGFR